MKKLKVNDYVVAHSPYEMRFAKGHIVAIDKKHVAVKDSNGTVCSFDLTDTDVSVVHATKPSASFKKQTVYVLYRNNEYVSEFKTIKQCYACIKHDYDFNFNASFKNFLSDYHIEPRLKLVCA